jgi:hypothetical protein
MRRAEGKGQRWKRVSLPHRRTDCCMRRYSGGGRSLELWIPSPVPAADLSANRRPTTVCADGAFYIFAITTNGKH